MAPGFGAGAGPAFRREKAETGVNADVAKLSRKVRLVCHAFMKEAWIPASIFKFANTDIEDNMEAFEDYCTDVRRDGDDLILEVTPTQKEELIEIYAESIDDVLEDMEKDEQGYYVEADTDHSRFIYHIDENIDGILQAKMLLTITTSDVLTGIMETGDPNWSVSAKIVNCHTGLTVGEGTFPDGSITFGPTNGRPAMTAAHGLVPDRKRLWT